MTPSLFRIDRAGPGWLATMARPGAGDRLEEELSQLHAAGVTVLVSALTGSEVVALGLGDEQRIATSAGLEFVSAPIPDLGLPEQAVFDTTTSLICRRLAGGAGVVTHCYAGIGRSSLLAAGAMVREGTTPAEAWARISHARGHPVPDLPSQRQWLDQWAARQPPRPPT
jgi:protein-tyrosine phosphatase